jgi:alpha-D-ribose 1-methylphosphonate 5-phosphate C-P lyase
MAKSPAPGRRRLRKPWGLWLVGIIAVLAGTAVFAFRSQISGYGSIAAAYSARVACSCRYVAGRPLDDCAKDKLAGMEAVTLVADDATKSVTARLPLVTSATATYREGYGCVLEPYEG